MVSLDNVLDTVGQCLCSRCEGRCGDNDTASAASCKNIHAGKFLDPFQLLGHVQM